MERSSSQRDLRVERLSKTPYSRPESSRLRKSTSMTPLATLKSIVSYVSSPFTKSNTVLPTHNNDLDITITDVDQRSESGSEDEWNGEAPISMQGQDIFSLAAAAGRKGDGFEERAANWRAKGEIPGGRRQLARLGLEAPSSSKQLEPPTPTAPGHFNLIKSSPSMPILSTKTTGQPTSSIRRAKSPLSSDNNTTTLPSRTPILSFIPPQTSSTPETKGLSSSASSVALTAFLEAKKGQQMTVEDFRVIETLTENMKAESHVGSPTKSDFSQTQHQNQKYGGWAAGTYSSGIKQSYSFSNLATPAKNSTSNNLASTPGTVFSVGTPNITTQASSPYRQRYLGPGMSPRRMFPQPKKSSLKPLFNFGASQEDDSSKGKKRKVDEEEIMDIDTTMPSTPFSNLASSSKGLSSSVSLPSLSTLANSSDKAKSKLSVPSHTPARPSPLSRNISSPGAGISSPVDEKAKRKAEAEAAGKKRAAEIIMDIIDEEIGPVIPTRKAEPVIFNPYDRTSLNPSPAPAVPTTQPSTAFAGSTPRKSALKSSTNSPARRTPTRGAAAKLELHKEAMKGSKPLTTIERIQGVKPWERGGSPSKSTKRVETPTPDDDIIEIDELVDESQASSSRAPSEAPYKAPPSPKKAAKAFESASVKIPAAETFKPFNPPSITFNSQPLPKSQPVPSIGSFDSPTRNSIIDSSKSTDQPIPKPNFSFGKPSTPTPSSELETTPNTEKKESTNKPTEVGKLDINKIYLSAKDSALKISKPALPFFTFTLPPRPLESSKPKKEVLDAALKRDQPTFTFNLTTTATSQSDEIAKEWTCDLCMLKNPASITDKCTVCEAPKPKSKSTAVSTPATTQPFSFGSSAKPTTTGGGEWTCGLCMLKNSASATDKCTVCEAPKPKAVSIPAPTPAFSFGSSSNPTTTGGGEWTCGLCMLKNPGSVTDKCTICDTPKPKSTSATTQSQPQPTQTGFGGLGGFGNPASSVKSTDQWTCTLCGLKNPESAKKECTICQNPR